MGKNKKPSLGRTLLKDKRHSRSSRGQGEKEQWLHTSELQDGYDWGRLNLRSVTEQTAIDEFLATAELADTEFTAEKGNVQIITSRNIPGVFSQEELEEIKNIQAQNEELVRVPRRPPWDNDTTPEKLDKEEKESFLSWRRQLALLQESDEKLLLTPYEKNLDVWRQLWRVIERSDVVCQIVDARNPLLYRCEDLDKYIMEVDSKKSVVLLMNKSDLLTESQRDYWCKYFTANGIRAIFWSALAESEKDESKTDEDLKSGLSDNEDESSEDETKESEETSENAMENVHDNLTATQNATVDCSKSTDDTETSKRALETTSESFKDLNLDSKFADTAGGSDANLDAMREVGVDTNALECSSYQNLELQSSATGVTTESPRQPVCLGMSDRNTTHLYTREELVDLFKTFEKTDMDRTYVTIGLVGYPNVGKSSTINALLQTKKTSVSATPGKTKHFQTLFYDNDLCLCDCPGLVFPHFVSSKAEMVLGGVLPIDEMKDCIPPVTLLCRYINRGILESIYGINIPKPAENEDQQRPPTAYELLACYAKLRGYMTSHGLPDTSRASRYILKDFVKGRLLYCVPPPDVSEEDFKPCSSGSSVKLTSSTRAKATHPTATEKIDVEFFSQHDRSAVLKAPTGFRRPGAKDEPEMIGVGKPWKKHYNKNKKEKLRRLQKP